MVIAANDVGDAHVVIIDHDCKHVGRGSIGTKEDHVVQFAVLDGYLALDLVLDRGRSVARRLQTDGKGTIRLLRTRLAVAPAAIVAQRLLVRPLFGSHHLKLFRRRVAFVSISAVEKRLCHFCMTRRALGLEHDVPVRFEAKPSHSIKNCVDGSLCRSHLVGIFDTEQKLATMVSREQPIEKRSARTSDMEKAGWRRREAGNDLCCAHALNLPGWCNAI